MLLTRLFIRRCKQRKRISKVADSTGADLTGGSLLLRSLILRRLIRRVIGDDEKYVGLLLPPSAGGAVSNMALALDRRIAVNLNYTVSSQVLNSCIAQCGMKHILTSRKFMEKMKFDLDAELVYLEDFKDKPSLSDKISAAIATYVLPAAMVDWMLGLDKLSEDDVLTVIFTSGSTGQPKGVMLTYGNVGSNAQAINDVVHIGSHDVLLGILPFFHSFGYTVTLWTAMTLDAKGAYHFSPLESKQVGKLCEKHNGTILLSTPTFLRSYLKRCEAKQFDSLEVVVTGAEKLPSDLCDKFEEKFDVRPVEGYGATETSPLTSVNVPASRSPIGDGSDAREGTVGRPVPGVTARVVNPDTGEELATGEAGMLHVKGPNIMKGYLGREDLTNEVIKDGWYITGDIAKLDEDGFIQITGRVSRFSKIGGEMVPHGTVEEAMAELVGQEEEVIIAITAVADERKEQVRHAHPQRRARESGPARGGTYQTPTPNSTAGAPA